MIKLILASSSERRLKLLEQIGVVPDLIEPPNTHEYHDRPNEAPREIASRLAREKTESVFFRHKEYIVLGADTLVTCGRRILIKPKNMDQAREHLSLLSGRRHRVYTALCVMGAGSVTKERVVSTVVKFKKLTEKEIESYLDGEEWKGKSGGYAIQGRAGMFVRSINGSYSNVVGLPLYETYSLLVSFNYPVTFK